MDPFKIAGKLFLAIFKITSYFTISIVQVIWYAAFRKPEKIGDAIGELGRGTVDAITDIFK